MKAKSTRGHPPPHAGCWLIDRIVDTVTIDVTPWFDVVGDVSGLGQIIDSMNERLAGAVALPPSVLFGGGIVATSGTVE